MRLLHTADLHLGRQFGGMSLEEDQQVILDQIVEAVVAQSADVLVIAGDIYDRAVPPAYAVRQFNTFLTRISTETTANVVLIAGNHDSGDRIASMAVMTDQSRALIRGDLRSEEIPLVLADDHGPVAFSALPFGYEYAAKACFDDENIHQPDDVIRAQVAAARRHLPGQARWVIVAHAFVAGATGSDSERPLARVGGIETVGVDAFDGASYVALGHLHKPQSVGAPHVRYSGAPLAFGFDEAGAEKSMTVVDIDAAGTCDLRFVPFRPLRGVRIIEGRFADILALDPSDDFIRACLTDETPVIDGMKRLRKVFPNACELTYIANRAAPERKAYSPVETKLTDPVTVIDDFLKAVRENGMTSAERDVATSTLDRIAKTGDHS